MGLSNPNYLCSSCVLFKALTGKCKFWNKTIDRVDLCPRVESELSKKYVEMVLPKPRRKYKWDLQ